MYTKAAVDDCFDEVLEVISGLVEDEGEYIERMSLEDQ